VDHGKTKLLDSVRGSAVAAREAGGITQHIGATEVPLDAILEVCGDLVKDKTFKVPGLLFIDTPGHHAFTTLRARGGALADLAILVVDVNEGLMPQTVESLRILKRYRTPFVVAANKVDLLPGWRKHPHSPFLPSLAAQSERVKAALDERLYDLVGKLYEEGFTGERYDRVKDFRTTVAIVPTSATVPEGIPDLLLTLIGLAQRFLEDVLRTEEGPAEGTILEVKEERGLGPTVDAIVYKGTLRKADTVVLGGADAPVVAKVRALLKPKPLDEIRDPQDRFDSVDEVSAAAGVKISARGLEGVVAGAPLRVAVDDPDAVAREVAEESIARVEVGEEGVLAKADAIGSLEALAFECKREGVALRIARVGPVARRDVIDAATIPEPLHRAILAFHVPVLPDAQDEGRKHPDVAILTSDIIYRLLEEYGTWVAERRREMEAERRLEIHYPGKILLLPEHVFRVSKPAIVGVRVLAGRVRPKQRLLREDGRVVGTVRSLRSGEESLRDARQGQEVAVAIEGVTVGRQIKPGDVLYVDLPESHARALRDVELTADEREVLERVCAIKRKEAPFWGM
jgi:translation initiation factor 5B